MANTKQKRTLHSLLKDLERDELIEIITELCKFDKKNKKFLEVFISGSDSLDYNALLEQAKKKIYNKFYSFKGNPRMNFDLRGAKSVLTEYAKIFKGMPAFIIDLRLYYVEMGTRILREYGDMYDSFYNSMLSVFEAVYKDLSSNSELIERFAKRLAQLTKLTKWMGYGYGDDISFSVNNLFVKAELNINHYL